MQHHTSYSGEESLVLASQSGNLHACQQIVNQHQDELRRTAYLLTGQIQSANLLAIQAFLSFFQQLHQIETDHDIRQRLLGSLARRYLDATGDHATESADPESFVNPESQRFNVDDERTRLRSALDRLDRTDRLALVLRDFNGLSASWVAGLLDGTSHDVEVRLDSVHERIRTMTGIRNDEPVYGVLTRVGFEASRNDLWPDIEEPLRALFARERRRHRAITGGIVGVVGLLLVAGVFWITGWQPWESGGGDSEPETAGASTPADAQFQALETPTISNSESPSAPEPTATPAPLPSASVPELQLMTAYGNLFMNNDRAQLIYDPATNSTEPLVEPSGFPDISVDGRRMVFHRFTPLNFDYPTALTVLDSETREEVWARGMAPIYDTAVGSERLYALTEGEDGAASWRIQVRALTTGEPASPDVKDLDDPELNEIIVDGNARLFLAPDESRLYLAADAPDHSAGHWQRVLISYALPGMEQLDTHAHTVQWQDGQFSSDFDVRRASPTPDGAGLYTLLRRDSEPASVQFLEADSGDMTSISIPFTPSTRTGDDSSPQRVISVAGNSGTKLYVLASVRGEVAVVDLRERRVERVFPLDPGEYADVLTLDQLGRGAFAAPVMRLSLDGGMLYVANIWENGNGPASAQSQFSVWVINTASWQVIDRWQVPGYITSMFLGGNGLDLFVRSTVLQSNVVVGNTMTTFDAANGEVKRSHRTFPMPEWAEGFWLSSPASLYRQQYGRAPAIGGASPGDQAIESTLPAIEVRAGAGPVPAGEEARISVRFADPATSETIQEAQPEVRFSPDASVTIQLSHAGGSGDDTVIVPQVNQEGFYQGSAILNEPGWWVAQIVVSNPDGSTWRTPPRRAIQVSGSAASTIDPSMICPVPIDTTCRPAAGTN